MTEVPEPEDKLDATTNVMVNGPEDAPFDWHAVDWRRVEDDVRRLRQRIFTASKAGDLTKVRQLQKLVLRSWYLQDQYAGDIAFAGPASLVSLRLTKASSTT